jgi:hypothetical protein
MTPELWDQMSQDDRFIYNTGCAAVFIPDYKQTEDVRKWWHERYELDAYGIARKRATDVS